MKKEETEYKIEKNRKEKYSFEWKNLQTELDKDIEGKNK